MSSTYRNRNTGTLVNVLARATHARTSVCLVVYRDTQQTDAPTYADSPEGFEARFEPVPAEVLASYSVPPCPEGKHPGGTLTVVKHPLLASPEVANG